MQLAAPQPTAATPRPLVINREPALPKWAGAQLDWGRPEGTLWARNRDSDSAADKARLSHVDQGALNDCYLQAVLGALAFKRPTVITDMVREHPEGIEVRLPSGPVVVSRSLPMLHGKPAFGASGPNKVLWPAYIEKAIAATLPNGYRDLDKGGMPDRAFQLLTGTAPTMLRSAPVANVIEGVAQLLHADRPVVVSTRFGRRGTHAREVMDRLGMYGNHVYVVTAADARRGPRALRLWNPWGMEQPKRPLTAREAAIVLSEVVSDTVGWQIDAPPPPVRPTPASYTSQTKGAPA